MTNAQTDALVSFAHSLADAADQAILPLFRSGLSVENKLEQGFDPVTAADQASERVMRERIGAHYPDHGILGEEFGTEASSHPDGLTWVLDPIDGTRGFISGTPTWGVLIAAGDANGPKLGLIDQPYIGERFMGGAGRAEVKGPLGQHALGVRDTTALDQATLFTTFPEVGTPQDRAAFERVADHVKLTRYGCDCYAYALLAAGQIDLVIEAKLQPYDIQGPIAVIEAAGGIVTDWTGGPAHGGGHAIAAATPKLHAAALDLLT